MAGLRCDRFSIVRRSCEWHSLHLVCVCDCDRLEMPHTDQPKCCFVVGKIAWSEIENEFFFSKFIEWPLSCCIDLLFAGKPIEWRNDRIGELPIIAHPVDSLCGAVTQNHWPATAHNKLVMTSIRQISVSYFAASLNFVDFQRKKLNFL